MKSVQNRSKLLCVALVATGVVASTAVGTAVADSADRRTSGTTVAGQLDPLNNSGVTGRAETHVRHRRLDVQVRAQGLAADLPHAQHIHFGAQARHECPAIADDANGDFRLTTSGPGSVLAVDRYPTAPEGEVHYMRTTRTKESVARGIRRGNAVVVIHGVDYNDNGEYDFDSAGASDLDPSLPAEATDPAACGVLPR